MFMPLEELETLTVCSCPALTAGTLTSISGADFARCNLKLLDFSNNPLLASLPLKSLAEIPSLRELACAGCPNLWSPPQEIAVQGGKECMDFARAALADGEVDTRMTLFLVGDGEAGKTSVFRAIKSADGRAERIREDTRTVGIDTEEWQPVAAESGRSLPLRFRVFDLAGQAVYEMTHQFFLLQRAVYMLVWRAFPLADDRRAVLTDRVRHWMRSLQLRVPGACVMLVVTHIDAVDTAVLDTLCGAVRATVQQGLADMHREAPLGGRVLSVLDGGESRRVNCLLGEGVAELRQQLLNFAWVMPWYGELLPVSFVGVRRAVERLVEDGTQLIPTAVWVQLCKEQGMEGPMLAVGTRFLHETGVVRFFGDAEALAAGGDRQSAGGDAMVYLSADFIVSVMKGLVRHDRQALQDYFVSTKDKRMLRRTNRLNATGRLHETLLPFLWPATEASRAYWTWVRGQGQREAELWPKDIVREQIYIKRTVELLEGFDLVVRVTGAQELLVPGALPTTRTQLSADAFVINAAVPFSSSRAFPALPPGAFQRIVVRVAGQADWSDFSADRAVFYLLGNVATLTWSDTAVPSGEANDRRTELQWRASSKQLCTLIAAAVDTIERFFPGLPRLDAKEETPASAREPTQVLILAASDESAALVEAAVREAARADGFKGLVVEVHGPGAKPSTQEELGRVRVLLVCMTAQFSATNASAVEAEAHLRAGHARVVPVLLAGFESQWGTLQQLARHPSADLRTCSATRADTEAAARQHIMDEERERLKEAVERAGLSKEGQSGEVTVKAPPTWDIEARVRRETDKRLEGQARDAVAAVRSGLLKMVKQLLHAWRMQPPSAYRAPSGGSASYALPPHDAVQCSGGGGNGCEHIFSRQVLEARSAAEDSSVTATGDASEICPQCKTKHWISDLLASPEVRQCPACTRNGKTAGGYFSARECRLRMSERLEQRSYAAPCRVCGNQVSLFDVFPPEVYALSTPLLAGCLRL